MEFSVGWRVPGTNLPSATEHLDDRWLPTLLIVAQKLSYSCHRVHSCQKSKTTFRLRELTSSTEAELRDDGSKTPLIRPTFHMAHRRSARELNRDRPRPVSRSLSSVLHLARALRRSHGVQLGASRVEYIRTCP